MTTLANGINKLNKIISILRNPDGGCPWDQKQTLQSMKSYLIEEAHEVAEAIDQEDPNHIKEELGDLFFQLTFINQLYAEKWEFPLTDAFNSICDKMVRRHPHVFGDEQVNSAEEQHRRWNEIKSSENNKQQTSANRLAGIPKSIGGLRRAQRVSERAVHNGFDWQNLQQALNKLDEEVDEFKQALISRRPEAVNEELGDILFMAVNLARLCEINADDCVQQATDKFISRFTKMEVNASKSFHDLTPNELMALWQSSKKELT
ncbi:MAG: nucleoside triphosphate pyrophosphohydrolase [Deltaproteobacteria bacterium]|nr:nucleoside triphosphate pyrophosphohydrolase [Deltaproteobacteria bacterium]